MVMLKKVQESIDLQEKLMEKQIVFEDINPCFTLWPIK